MHSIENMQLCVYLIRNQAPHVINSHVHLAVAILSGKKNEVVRQYVLHVAHSSVRFSCLYK